MIGHALDQSHDPRPLTVVAMLRLLVAAATVVAIQVSLLDPVTVPVLRHLDLPLVVASVLILARPTHSTAIGLIFGLMVDASAQRLFGIHCLAYTVLGPLARSLPVPAWRSGAVVAWRVATQAFSVAVIVAVGQGIAAGRLLPGTVEWVVQTAAAAGLLAVPLSRLIGTGTPLRRHQASRARIPRRRSGRSRIGGFRPLGP